MIRRIITSFLILSAMATTAAEDLSIDMSNGLMFTAENNYMIVFGTTVTPPPPSLPDPILRYMMDDNAADYIVTESVSAINGTSSVATDGISTQGILTNALTLTYNSAYITYPVTLQSSGTVSVWAKFDSFYYDAILEALTYSPVQSMFDIYVYNSLTVYVGWWSNWVDQRVTFSTSLMTVGGWDNIVCTWENAGQINVYLNSVLMGTVENMSTFWDTTGASVKSDGSFKIDDLRIYDVALTSNQVVSLYSSYGGTTSAPPSTVSISFDYNYFDSNMQATLEYSSAEYTRSSAFGSLPSCTSIGPRYTFNNWQDSSYNVYTTSSTVPSSPMTLHASFSDAGSSSYNLTFDLQGGSGSQPTIPLWDGWQFWVGDYGFYDYFPGDATYSGYAFGGWFTQPSGAGTRVYSTDTYYYSTYYGSVTLYAYWQYALTFDPQGGTSNSTLIPLTYGQPYSLGGGFPTDPTLDGYTFGGWFTETGGSGTQINSYDYFYGSSTFVAYAYWY